MLEDHQKPLIERLSVLETERTQIKEDIKDIKAKLDQLLDLKSRGLGAVWLIGLLIGSALVGIFDNLGSILANKPHP